MSIPKEHVHITFLTPWIVFVGILGFQSITLRCKTPCIRKIDFWLFWLFLETFGQKNVLMDNPRTNVKGPYSNIF